MKKIVAILLTILMLSMLISCDIHIPFLDDIKNSDDANDSKLEYELRGDVYYVVGIGDKKLSDIVENGELIIPSTYRGKSVVGIANGAFDGIFEYDYYDESSNQGYFNIIIEEGIQSIGKRAFADCTGLRSIALPSTLTEIGEEAFNGCKKLETFQFGESLKTIGDSAFSGCASLAIIILPDSLTSLGKEAFSSCSGVKELHIGRGINEIPESAFSSLRSLEKLVIPDHITAIHRGAFDNLTKLKEITIPKSVTYFEYCFNSTRNIESIYYEGTLEDWLSINFDTVGSSPFYYSSLAKLYLDGVVLEGDLVIPKGITVIPNRAFERYAHITSISFPHDMKYIGDAAFYGCQGLESVKFEGDVDIFGSQIFYGCVNIASIDFGNKLSKIGSGMFSCCGDIERLVIPSSVKVIYSYCFSSCNIGELILSEGIEEIRGSAFAYGSIPEIHLPSTIKYLGSLVFWQVDEVYYNGTMEQWNEIERDRWYERYDEYYIHCIDGDIYVPPYYS